MYAIWPSLLINSVFGVVVIFVLFFIPLIILIYCNGRILWILTRRIDLDSSKSDAPSLNNTPATRDTFQLARTNTLKTFLLVGLCFIICWSNNQIYFLMYNLGYEINWNGTEISTYEYWNKTWVFSSKATSLHETYFYWLQFIIGWWRKSRVLKCLQF